LPAEDSELDAAIRRDAAEASLRAHAEQQARDAARRGPPDWVSRLPSFRGQLHVDGAAVELATLDFGKVRRRRPAAVLRPAGAEDVVSAMRFCRAEGVPLSPRGCAHSAGGQMMVADGLVLDMKSMDRVLRFGDGWCDVEGGIQWGAVLTASLEHGLTPVVVTDWLGVSVGGTLSMGGFGFMSFRRGTQMDHVLELDVVTGEGELVTCSPALRPEVFDAVRGTHGKFGIIVRARVALEPAPQKVRMVQACYGSFRAMMADLQAFTEGERADLVHAFAAQKTAGAITTRMNSTDRLRVPEAAVQRALDTVQGDWVFNLELVDLVHEGRPLRALDTAGLRCEPGLVDTWELSWRDFCFRLPPLIIEEQLRGAAPHPEICLWVPMDEAGLAFVEREYARMRPREDHGNGPNLFFPVRVDRVGAPLFRLPAAGPWAFFWGLLRRADPETPERMAEQVADNEVIYARAQAVGAVRYLPDTPPETDAFWAQHFGPLWERVRALKRKFDPAGVLASSFGAAASR
jgi:FAD/FMN-containing dehydrogenase